MPSIDGLITGIDTTKIIEGLLSIQQQQIDRLESRKTEVNDEQKAFKKIEARLLSLRNEAAALSRLRNSVFTAKTATSSNESLVKAAASNRAVPGVHSLTVNAVARAHQIASQGFADPDSTITQGTFSLQVGDGTTTTVTIDDGNHTLQGLADAINNSGAEVSATIVNDGTTGHRLLLTADETGAENAITVTNNLAADNNGAIQPVIDGTRIAPAVKGAGYTGTSEPTSNSGGGAYTGTDDDTYTFTVTSGGTVGTDNNITIDYVDGSGENSGTITLSDTDVDVFKTVAEGLQVKFSSGTLVEGETFTVDVFATPPPVQAAADASVTLGSGAGALTVQSETNQIEDLISGVTLDLLAADTTQEVTVTVARDTESAKEAVTGFVESFNGLMEFIDDSLRFDPETLQASILTGNRSVISIQDSVRRTVTEVVEGLKPQMNRLSALGISVTSEGRLSINSAELDEALAGEIDGVTADDLRRLFTLDGQVDNANIRFLAGSTRTKARPATPYEVDVTSAAERASILATGALADSTTIDSSNNTLTISVDGKTSNELTLTDGTYTRQELADHLEAVINADEALTVRTVSVSVESDKLRITSDVYGSASDVTIESGTALSALGFSGSESDRGQDVVGKFIVDGVEETATGNGRLLVGNADNENTADVQLFVSLGSSQVQAGTDAELTVTRGIASRLDQTLNALLDPASGQVKLVNDTFGDRIEDIEDSIERQNERFESQRESLIEQFVALERAVAELQSTGNFLAAQLGGVNSLTSSGGL